MNFCDPQSAVLQLGLRDDMRVGDFGAGPGDYAVAAAKIVGNDGRVYAVDVQEALLQRLTNYAVECGVGNIETIWGDIEQKFGSRMRDNALDAGILTNTLFQIEDKAAAIAEIKRVLKPAAKLLVIDWSGAYGGIGPKEEEVVAEHEAEKLFLDAGFHKEKGFRAGPHHYALVFSNPT